MPFGTVTPAPIYLHLSHGTTEELFLLWLRCPSSAPGATIPGGLSRLKHLSSRGIKQWKALLMSSKTIAYRHRTLHILVSIPLNLPCFARLQLTSRIPSWGPQRLLHIVPWVPCWPGEAAALMPPLQWLRCGALLLQHAVRLLPPQWLPYFLGRMGCWTRWMA